MILTALQGKSLLTWRLLSVVLTLFCTKSVRLLGMLFSDLAVVFFGRCYCCFPDAVIVFLGCSCCFLRTLLSFSSVSAVFVSCFCTKLLEICTKQNIFCTKNGENFSMPFRTFPYFLIQIPDSFAFFSWLFRRKNPFFLIRLSVNDRIYSYQPYVFHAFFGRLDRFFDPFQLLFLHFSVVCR